MHWPSTARDVDRLRETLVWVAERSPYYRRTFEAAGVRPADLHTYDDFRTRVPRTEKTDLAANQRAHPPFGEFLAVPRGEIASLHTSPGPIYIPRLAEERGGTPVLVEAIAAMGVKPPEALTPALRQQLRAAVGIELFDHIGEAQIGPVAGECRMHAGMHLHAHDLLCEFLDPESGAPVGPGSVGELVVTQLGHHALPLVRYAPRDAYRLLPGTCPCGNPAPRVAFVGQVGAIKKIKGALVHPAQIHAVTSQFPELGRFQVVVEHPAGERYERATLRAGTVRPPADADALRRTLAERLKATVLIQMEVALVPEGDVPETAGPPAFAEALVKR